MPRLTNRNTLATKALAIDDASSDELIALEDAVRAAQRALNVYLIAHPAERKRRQILRDHAPIARSNAPFSIFADTSRDPKPAA